jgi:hypothetical protein
LVVGGIALRAGGAAFIVGAVDGSTGGVNLVAGGVEGSAGGVDSLAGAVNEEKFATDEHRCTQMKKDYLCSSVWICG